MFAQPQDINELRRLLASGQVTEDQLVGMTLRGRFGGGSPAPVGPGPQNELARLLSPQEEFAQGGGEGDLPMGSMRNEATGKVTYFKPGGGGFSAQPYPANAAPQARPKIRLAGYGNGTLTDLGEEDARALPVDYTRPAIDIPGLGKGRYTADGRYAVVSNPDGSQTKVVLGYDADASQRRNDADLKRQRALAEIRQTEQAIAQSKEQVATSVANRTRRESNELVPGAGVSQAVLEKQFGKAPDGKRWNARGELEDVSGGNKKIEDAKDVLSILDQAEPLIDKSTGSYGGFAIDKLMQLFGYSTEGANAGASLKALQGLLVSKMPKMSGPQSDKDVLLYKEMAGQIGDPTIPADQKKAAMATIREINTRYAGGDAATGGRVESNMLPSPQQYTGKVMTDTQTGIKYRSNGTNWVRQ